jgi:hypothetical protein
VRDLLVIDVLDTMLRYFQVHLEESIAQLREMDEGSSGTLTRGGEGR